jgi:hypothetical protein
MISKYTYLDARDGTKYEAHTCTYDKDEDGTRMSGADLRYTIMEGGDHTASTKKVLGIGPMGSTRGNS